VSNFIQNIETGKVGRFIGSVQAQGKGLLHLVEDAETGFLSAFPTLEKYRVASQDVIDSVTKDVDAVDEATAADAAIQAAQAPTGDPSQGAVASPPANLAGTGIQPEPQEQGPVTADPGMPPLGS
jgi:hypothetical protein